MENELYGNKLVVTSSFSISFRINYKHTVFWLEHSWETMENKPHENDKENLYWPEGAVMSRSNYLAKFWHYDDK